MKHYLGIQAIMLVLKWLIPGMPWWVVLWPTWFSVLCWASLAVAVGIFFVLSFL